LAIMKSPTLGQEVDGCAREASRVSSVCNVFPELLARSNSWKVFLFGCYSRRTKISRTLRDTIGYSEIKDTATSGLMHSFLPGYFFPFALLGVSPITDTTRHRVAFQLRRIHLQRDRGTLWTMQPVKISVPRRVRLDMGHVRESYTVALKTSHAFVARHFRHPLEATCTFWRPTLSVTCVTSEGEGFDDGLPWLCLRPEPDGASTDRVDRNFRAASEFNVSGARREETHENRVSSDRHRAEDVARRKLLPPWMGSVHA
jgi:hypothetical protein